MVKFLHTADWQIEKPFSGKEPELAEDLREARIQSARNIVDLADEENVDFILIAGDLFEKRFPDEASRTRIYDILTEKDHIPVIIVAGNHDPIAPGSFYTEFPYSREDNNLHIPDTPECIELADVQAVVLTNPLRKKNDTNDPTDQFPDGPDDVIRIGATHGQLKVGNRWNRDGFPIDPDAVDTHDLDYLALGDWHSRYAHSDRIHYPGTHEPGAYGDNAKVLTVEMDEHGQEPDVREHDVSTMTWMTIEKDLSPDGAIEDLENELDELEEDSTLLQLKVTGTLAESEKKTFDHLVQTTRDNVCELVLKEEGLRSTVSTDELLEKTDSHPFLSGAIADLIRLKRSLDPDATEDIPEGNFNKLDKETLNEIRSSVEEFHASLDEKHSDLSGEDVDNVLQKLNGILDEEL